MNDAAPQDLANFATRQAIAERQNAQYRQVLAWAHQIMDRGWLPVGRHFLLDKADEDRCRKTGERPTPAATCYSVSNGVSKRHFIVKNGQPVEVADYKQAFGTMLEEPHPTMKIEVKGQMVAPHPYSLCWAPVETYEPRTTEQLAENRAKREKRELKQEADANPLYREQILAEGHQKPPRKRGR